MKLFSKVEVLVVCCAALAASLPLAPDQEEDNMINYPVGEDLEGSEPTDPEQLSEYLTSLLTDENADLPLVYLPQKRSRYYRRYPWKRQNGRNYDPDAYLCTPTRQDVFHLLMALHDARSGNLDRQIHFCNRKRPARAIFTNIRFLGRR